MWTENFLMCKLDLEKEEEPESKLQTSFGSYKKQEISRKTFIYFCFIDNAKVFNCMDHRKLWQTLHISLRYLYARRKWQSTRSYSKNQTLTNRLVHIGKGMRQGCILSLSLFNLHAEYIMQNAGLDESQAGIKILQRNINSPRYADDTTLRQKMKRNQWASWWGWKRKVKNLA